MPLLGSHLVRYPAEAMAVHDLAGAIKATPIGPLRSGPCSALAPGFFSNLFALRFWKHLEVVTADVEAQISP